MFGFVPSIQTVASVGLVVFVLLVFQIMLGMRWIKLKGRTHWKVHKYVAWTIFAIACVHLALGLALSGFLGLG